MPRDVERNLRWRRDWYNKMKSDPEYIAKVKKRAHERYLRDREKIIARTKKYAADHKELYQKATRKHYALNRREVSYIFTARKAGARNHGTNWTIGKEEFTKWWCAQPRTCHYCKRDLALTELDSGDSMNRGKLPTIDRINNLKGYELGNVVLSCARCNFTKSDYFSEQEMILIGGIIRKKSGSNQLYQPTLDPDGNGSVVADGPADAPGTLKHEGKD